MGAIVTVFASLTQSTEEVNAWYNAIQNPTAKQTAQRDLLLALATLYALYDQFNTEALALAGTVKAVCDAYEAAEAIREANKLHHFVMINPVIGAGVPSAIPQVRLDDSF